MIVKQMIKFVFLNTKSIFMKTVKYHHFLLTILFLFINTTNIKSQDLCEWIYSDLDPDSYIIDENGTPVLFFCSDDTPTIYAPTPTELSDSTAYLRTTRAQQRLVPQCRTDRRRASLD